MEPCALLVLVGEALPGAETERTMAAAATALTIRRLTRQIILRSQPDFNEPGD
jgi:hypothetical protein